MEATRRKLPRYHPTLCFDCQNAVPNKTRGCEWSRYGQPVPGWTAHPTLIRTHDSCPNSFCVVKCPKYDPDPPRPWAPDLTSKGLPIFPRSKEEFAV